MAYFLLLVEKFQREFYSEMFLKTVWKPPRSEAEKIDSLVKISNAFLATHSKSRKLHVVCFCNFQILAEITEILQREFSITPAFTSVDVFATLEPFEILKQDVSIRERQSSGGINNRDYQHWLSRLQVDIGLSSPDIL